jgi:hypothetical protein
MRKLGQKKNARFCLAPYPSVLQIKKAESWFYMTILYPSKYLAFQRQEYPLLATKKKMPPPYPFIKKLRAETGFYMTIL